MTPVMKAEYRYDDKYPIFVAGPTWWEKMSRDEAITLANELIFAVQEADQQVACGTPDDLRKAA